jgi:NADPH:quinone reductase-like Zn-dependent oxidoreductase
MKAIVQNVYGPLDNMRLVELDKPVPTEKSVLIRVRAAGIDPGIWHTMTGRPFMVRLMGLGFSGPKTPVAGWDAAGVVEAVGAGVTGFKPGDEIYGNSNMKGTGTFAEYACLPEDSCAMKPASLSFEQAAALAVSGCTALQTVRDAGNVTEGKRVLILGAAGGVGHLALQIAKACGAKVTAVCATDKLELVRSLAADQVIDYTREGLGERQWDVIIDTAGRRPIGELRRVLAPDGVLAIVGGEGGNPWTGGFLERMAAASFLSLASSQKVIVITSSVKAADLLALNQLVEAGKLKPHIDRAWPLSDGVSALKELERGHARGKSVVVLD